MKLLYGRDDYVGWFYEWGRGSGNARLLAANLVGLLFIFAFVTGIMGPFFLFLNYMGWFRADALEEIVGLDVRYSGGADPTTELVDITHLNALREQMQKRYNHSTTTATALDSSNLREQDDDGDDQVDLEQDEDDN